MKHGKDQEVRIGEKPLPGFRFRGLGSSRQSSQMAVARQFAQMIEANAGQADNFIFGEELLAGFDSDHATLLGA
jgi:hypothetical protein